jgi:hypothetical protein
VRGTSRHCTCRRPGRSCRCNWLIRKCRWDRCTSRRCFRRNCRHTLRFPRRDCARCGAYPRMPAQYRFRGAHTRHKPHRIRRRLCRSSGRLRRECHPRNQPRPCRSALWSSCTRRWSRRCLRRRQESSWFLIAVHTPFVHVWHAPAQSLLVTHPTHWLLAVSHLAATPVQCLSAVHATQRPLLAQAGPFRPTQSVSPAHFAHRLFKHRGLGDEQSLSVLQVPGASTVGASGARSTGRASGAVTTAGLSGGAESATDPSIPGLALAPPEPPNPPTPPDPVPPPAASERPRLSIFSGPSLPLPPTGAQRKSAVQAKPGWHISAGGEQTLQSRSPAPAASVDPWLSTATRPSVPLSGSTQRQSSVQTYPGLHGALDAQYVPVSLHAGKSHCRWQNERQNH